MQHPNFEEILESQKPASLNLLAVDRQIVSMHPIVNSGLVLQCQKLRVWAMTAMEAPASWCRIDRQLPPSGLSCSQREVAASPWITV